MRLRITNKETGEHHEIYDAKSFENGYIQIEAGRGTLTQYYAPECYDIKEIIETEEVTND